MDWKASGVMSRPVTPVPPVEITTSTSGSAIQVRSVATNALCSSLTMRLAAMRWPALVARSTSVRPDLSDASSRVSETVRIAMLTGTKGRLSSIVGDTAFTAVVYVESGIDRPAALGKRVEISRRLAETQAINPIIGHHAFGEGARFGDGERLQEHQRIAAVVGHGDLAVLDRTGAAVISEREEQQVALDVLVVEQRPDIFLRQHQVGLGIGQLLALSLAIGNVLPQLRRHRARRRRHKLHQAACAGIAHDARREFRLSPHHAEQQRAVDGKAAARRP